MWMLTEALKSLKKLLRCGVQIWTYVKKEEEIHFWLHTHTKKKKANPKAQRRDQPLPALKMHPDPCCVMFYIIQLGLGFLYLYKKITECVRSNALGFNYFGLIYSVGYDHKYFAVDERLRNFAMVLSSVSNSSVGKKKRRKRSRTREYFWVDKSLWTQWVATTMHCFQPVTSSEVKTGLHLFCDIPSRYKALFLKNKTKKQPDFPTKRFTSPIHLHWDKESAYFYISDVYLLSLRSLFLLRTLFFTAVTVTKRLYFTEFHIPTPDEQDEGDCGQGKTRLAGMTKKSWKEPKPERRTPPQCGSVWSKFWQNTEMDGIHASPRQNYKILSE